MADCTKKITVQVVQIDDVEFPASCQKDICCCDYVVNGIYWRQPVLDKGGNVIYYQYIAQTESKPSTDSIKVVKLVACGHSVQVVIPDADTTDAKIKEACDLCCGDTPIEFDETIPTPISEQYPCENADGDRIVSIAYPTCSGNLVFAATSEGVDITPAPAASYANAAAIKTAWDSDWTAYGVMTHDATTKVLSVTLADGVTSLGMTITCA